MGQHYVAQHYLKGFQVGSGIWVFDRKASQPFPSVPKSIANETKMWPQAIEDFITQDIEGPANPVLTKLRNRQPISAEERLALARYIIVQWKRTPAARARVYSHVPAVAEELRPTIHRDLDALLVTHPELRDQIEARRRDADLYLDKYKAMPEHPAIWYQGLPNAPERLDRMAQAVSELKWCFLEAGAGDQFLTSDNPVYYHERYGLMHPDSELSVPLGHDLALLAGRNAIGAHIRDGAFAGARSKLVHEINRRTAHNRDRFVFAARNEPWIVPFLSKPAWQLRSIKA